jgi:sec-independent protein translocase protein TatC
MLEIDSPQTTAKMLLKDHLGELTTRLYWCLGIFTLGAILGYANYQKVLAWLVAPLNEPIYYTSPTGGFQLAFDIAVFCGLLAVIPAAIYHIIRFVEPAFPHKHVSKLLVYVAFSILLALIGTGSAYYLLLPATLNFFSKFGEHQLKALISTSEYFSFVTKYLGGFALMFQFPLIMSIVDLFHPISTKWFINKARYVIVFSFIVAAILTPTPDFINQTLMALPIILLYLLSALIFWIRDSTIYKYICSKI